MRRAATRLFGNFGECGLELGAVGKAAPPDPPLICAGAALDPMTGSATPRAQTVR